MFRDNDGSGAVGGGLNDGLTDPASDDFADGLSLKLKLKWLPLLVGAGLIIAGDTLFKKSRYAEGGVIGVLNSSLFKMLGE